MTYAIVDIETTTHTSYKRKANPFDPRNWVVMVGCKRKSDAAPWGQRLTPDSQEYPWLVDTLRNPGTQFIVGANIKFDLLHLLKNPDVYAAWMQYVERGGLVWDVQLAEYLLEGQQQASHMLSLDELAVRYGGDLKVDEVKRLWEAGVPTEDIDPDLLTRYLLGETLPNGERREGDIGNTELIFLKQVERTRKQGQSRSILLNMGSLCATVEMERNGMFVNVPLGHELAAKLAEKLAAAEQRLAEYLPKDLPFPFNWTNRYHLSPLIFGGTIGYERRQYDLKDGRTTWFSPEEKPQAAHLFAYAQKDETHVLLQDGTTMELSAWQRLDHGLTGGGAVVYASGKNKGEPKTKKVKVDDITKTKSRMAKCELAFPGFTQPNEDWASSTEGLYSVSADVIESLGNRNIPFLKDLASVKAMDKDLGTYFIRKDKDGIDVGMLTLVQPDSIIHHMLNHTSTVTGRFSSSNPNLQNIPKGNKSDVKQVFESRWGTAGYILQSDFSSLEVYVQAILTHCANLILDLKNGIDLHCMRLALKEHMEYGEVFALCKGDKFDQEWDYKRTGAKVFSFQRAYGAGPKKIAESTGMPIEEVEALIAAEQARYPEIDAYFEARTKEIEANRVPTSRVVPHPKFPALMCQLGLSQVSTPDGKRYTYMESPALEFQVQRGQRTSFSPTEIKNYEVQGEGGEWMKAAMWLAIRAFYRTGNFNGLALLVNTVHDAQYADAHESVRVEAGALLHACMLEASTFMEWYFKWPLPLPVPSDTVHGRNMGEESAFKDPEFQPAMEQYRALLRKEYIGNHKPSFELP